MTWLPMPYSKVSAGRNAMPTVHPSSAHSRPQRPGRQEVGREELRPLNYPSPGLLSTAAVSRFWGAGVGEGSDQRL